MPGCALNKLLLILLCLLLLPAPAAAESSFYLEATRWEDQSLRRGGDGNRVSREDLRVGGQWQQTGRDLGLVYAYQPLLIRSGNPASNGYLHQLSGLYRQDLGAGLSLQLTVGLHGSSNMFRRLDFHRQALVGSFMVLKQFEDNPILDAFGAGADYKFGRFQYYPRMDRTFALGTLDLAVELPTGMYLQPHHRNWTLALYRYGEKWGTLDRQREYKGALYLSEWRLEFNYLVPLPTAAATLQLRTGYSFDNAIRYEDLDAGVVKTKFENSAYAGIGLHW